MAPFFTLVEQLPKNITPRTDRCGVKGKLNAEQLLLLAQLIEVNNDATGASQFCKYINGRVDH